MFKYHLMGNVYKETYNVGGIPIDNNTDEILSKIKSSHHSSQINCRKYGYTPMPIIFYADEEEYRLSHKIHNPNIEYKDVFDRYEEFDFIETDREFKDRDIILIEDKEYSISYKFNKDLDRHELYFYYKIKTEIDESYKKQCQETMKELYNKIKDYNDHIDSSEVVLDKRYECFIEHTEPKKSLITRFKEWFCKNTNN